LFAKFSDQKPEGTLPFQHLALRSRFFSLDTHQFPGLDSLDNFKPTRKMSKNHEAELKSKLSTVNSNQCGFIMQSPEDIEAYMRDKDKEFSLTSSTASKPLPYLWQQYHPDFF
jgi:hypothetical protein